MVFGRINVMDNPSDSFSLTVELCGNYSFRIRERDTAFPTGGRPIIKE